MVEIVSSGQRSLEQMDYRSASKDSEEVKGVQARREEERASREEAYQVRDGEQPLSLE